MAEKGGEIPLSWQAEALSASRSSLYYTPIGLPSYSPLVRRNIDKIYTASPFSGSRRISKTLKAEYGLEAGRKAVRGHIAQMGIEAIYPKPRTSKPGAESNIFPCLLEGLQICKTNQAWCVDITYIPLRGSFCAL
ncbi:MAG: IS3 family transposase [Eubacteriaceae bacterium]|nr:IS3 family transposase [Eubacteriaceae bacterium]